MHARILETHAPVVDPGGGGGGGGGFEIDLNPGN